jgi:hypothetical protein
VLCAQAERSQHYAGARKLLLTIMTIRAFNILFLCTVYRIGEFFKIGFKEYDAIMVPVNIAAAAAALAALLLDFRRRIAAHHDVAGAAFS